MKSYVTLTPNSLTNPTDKYLVVEYGHWSAFRNGGVSRLVPQSVHDDYADAHNAAVELNRDVVLG
jgi:hypothetical protein